MIHSSSFFGADCWEIWLAFAQFDPQSSTVIQRLGMRKNAKFPALNELGICMVRSGKIQDAIWELKTTLWEIPKSGFRSRMSRGRLDRIAERHALFGPIEGQLGSYECSQSEVRWLPTRLDVTLNIGRE